ncbi:MAG: hypothetical protein KFF73_05000, partial [Cyclobacteriaceae bacterium]|nr:hypothetical protein [Cyclobacteriaceae bacterium]
MKRSYFLITLLSLNLSIGCQQGQKNVSENKVTIDPGKASTPISPLIYGQFIEHLGRCIYGGIWAEMLEDRKFYYPITADYNPWGTSSDPFWNAGEFRILVASPWKIIGSPEAVTMTARNPFVGEHDPVVNLIQEEKERGIGQEGLVFEANREYTGSIYLAASSTDITVKLRVIPTNNDPIPMAEYTGLKNEYGRYEFKFISHEDLDEASLDIV